MVIASCNIALSLLPSYRYIAQPYRLLLYRLCLRAVHWQSVLITTLKCNVYTPHCRNVAKSCFVVNNHFSKYIIPRKVEHNYFRPLQINLFPVHRSHPVTVSSKINIRILPLFSGYCCILTGSFETTSAHVLAMLSSRHKLHICAIFATSKGRKSANLIINGPPARPHANMLESRTGNKELYYSTLLYIA